MLTREPPLLQQLAEHLERPVDQASLDRARLHLLDWLACVAGARRSELATLVARAVPDPIRRSAFLGNLLEMDDVHRSAILHPGPVSWPAALLAGQGLDMDMKGLLAGAVRGYEACIAVGATFDNYHYAHWHNSSTAGLFGASAASASVLGLTVDQNASALGNAGSVAGGLWHLRHVPVMTKAFHIAHAVDTGLAAARLAAQAFTGSPSLLEGPQGLYSAMTRSPRPLQLHPGWRLFEVSLKPWAACRHAHPAIDGALELRSRGELAFPLQVETYADAVTFCDQPDPTTPSEARFSIQHSVAVVALRGEPAIDDFEAQAIADPEISRLRRQVEVREDPAISARFPDHFGARLTTPSGSIALEDTLGDPERPLAPEGVITKALALFRWGGLDEAQARRAIDLALDGQGEAQAIAQLLEDWL